MFNIYISALGKEFQSYYDDVVTGANLASSFDEETVSLTGKTFRDLMEEGSNLVIQNLNTIQQK